MTTEQVKQALELALSLASDIDNPEVGIKIQEALLALNTQQKTTVKSSSNPVNKLIKGLEINSDRLEQFQVIYKELTVIGINFSKGKQNQHITWFPLEWNGDKTAALYLGVGTGWAVSPRSVKANGELSGEWEGFDLLEQISVNNQSVDVDEW